jgi:hypothetical protein
MLLYFTRGQIAAEKQYYPADPEMVELVLSHQRESAMFNEMDWLFKNAFGESLAGALRKPASGNPYADRIAQLVLFTLVGLVAESFATRKVDAAGFYSAGSISAALYAGLYDMRDLMGGLFGFFSAYFDAAEAAKRRNNWRDFPLCTKRPLEESETARHIIAGRVPQVYLKDRRGASAALLAGDYLALKTALAAIDAQIGLASPPDLETPRVGAAHTPVLRDAKYRALLENSVLKQPRLPILAGNGALFGDAPATQSELRDFVYDAVADTMNTGEICRRAKIFCDRIMVVGTQRSLNTFVGVDSDARPPIEVITTRNIYGSQAA